MVTEKISKEEVVEVKATKNDKVVEVKANEVELAILKRIVEKELNK